MKTHIITGASSGIGKAIYLALIDRGDSVVPVVRDQSVADELGAVEFITADFANLNSAREAFKNYTKPVDSFINCAGIAIGKPIWDNCNQELVDVINVNLLAPLIALGELKNNFTDGASIFLFSSRSAQNGGWDDIYIASKGGIDAVVKSLSLKFAPKVRVIGIAPGVTAGTRMTNERKDNDIEKVIKAIPLKRLAQTKEVAALVLSLMGSAGQHITGAMIDVNGGQGLR